MMEYVRLDTCIAQVIGCNGEGVYLVLDNGESAFAYGFTSLKQKSMVYCTIRKSATENKSALVYVDAVCESLANVA